MSLDLPPPPAFVPDEDLRTIDAAEVAAFHERGFCTVEALSPPDELAWVGAVYDALFAEKRGSFAGGYFDLARPYDSEGEDTNPQLLMPELRVPDLARTAYARSARRIAATLLDVPPDALQWWGHMIRKPARIGSETPWHQDEAYWDADRSYAAIGGWMPLDPATVESGCLHFVPGSHRGEVLPHRHVGDDPRVHALWTDQAETSNAVAVPLHPGDATFHHPRTLHHAGPNVAEHPRRAWAVEHQLAPIVLEQPAERPWVREGRAEWDRRPAVAAAIARRG